MIIPLIILGAVSLVVAYYISKQKDIKGANWAAIILIAAGIWVLAQSVECSRVSLEDKIFWQNIEYSSGLIGLYAYFFFTLKFTGKDEWVNWKTLLGAAIFPAVLIGLLLTNNQHHLIFTYNFQNLTAPVPQVDLIPGPLIWLIIFYYVTGVIFSAIILINSAQYIIALYLTQIIFIITASFFPVFIGTVNIFINPIPHFQLIGIAFNVAALTTASILYLLRKLNVKYSILHNAINLFFEPYLLLDADGNIIELNTAANALNGKTRSETLQTPLQKAWSELFAQIHSTREAIPTSKTVVLKIGENLRTYNAVLTPALNAGGEVIMHSIVLKPTPSDSEANHDLIPVVEELQNYQYITEALLDMESLTDVMQKVTDAIVTNFGFQAALIIRYSPEENMLHGLAFSSKFSSNLKQRIKTLLEPFQIPYNLKYLHLPLQPGNIPAIDRALAGETVIISHLRDLLEGWLPSKTSNHLEQILGIHQSGFVPLRFSDHTQGIIFVTCQKANISTHRKKALQRIAQQAAIALNNALLYAQAQQEIAERKETEALLKQSEQDYRGLFENAHDAIIIFEPTNETVLDVNQRACEMYKIPRDKFIGLSFESLSVNVERGKQNIAKTLKEGSYQKFETIHRLLDGTIMHLEINASVVEYHGKKAIVSINRDITEQIAVEEKLRFDALHDELTNLPNRTLFLERLKHAISRQQREPNTLFAVLFLDLDNFKNINDTLGHDIGDKYLIQISKRLTKNMRKVDLVARFGGDEFAVLLESIKHLNDIYDICSRLLQSISLPVKIKEHELIATASIGVVVNSPIYTEPKEMLRDADIAMYRAKSSGGSNFEIFDEEMRKQFLLTLQIKQDIQRAITHRDFILHYQPIIRLTDNKITGFEALLRWQHPKNGLLLPAEFIPIANKSNLILQIDRFVFDEACKQVTQWNKDGIWDDKLFLFINVSAKQLVLPSYLEHIESVLEKYPLNPARLGMDITESAFMDNFKKANRTLHRLRTKGFHVHLDDFGKGYSSLSYLNQLPISAFKIDMSLIQNINAPNIPQFIKSMISMGHDLGLYVSAEGVETEEQSSFLKSAGCDFAQGYYYYKPLDHHQVEEVLIHREHLSNP